MIKRNKHLLIIAAVILAIVLIAGLQHTCKTRSGAGAGGRNRDD